VGGLEGDFHKGLLPGNLAPSLLDGVRLHRAIDAYTDSHPALAVARAEFPAVLRRYAGILMDLCFDHFLQRHWTRFSDVPQQEFNVAVYAMLDRNAEHLSHRARHMANRLEEFDLLTRYGEWDTIVATAERIGQRLRHDNPMHRTAELVPALLPQMEQVFLEFYPDLLGFSNSNAILAASK